ncbi:MAG: hypothetical protein EOO88_23105, partial [Pedobacter sp.]
MNNKLSAVYVTLNVLMLWFALIIQFYISTKMYVDAGRTTAGAIVEILSFYTIQTNLLIAVALSAILFKPASTWGRFFSQTSVLTSIAVYIMIVGLIYATILKGIWKLEGLFKLTDFLLHTLSPIMYVVFWMVFVPKTRIPWKVLVSWAVFPFIYLIYALIRGANSGYYPYPFVNAAKFGYTQ